MEGSAEKMVANYDAIDSIPLFARASSRDLPPEERRQVSNALPKLLAFIAVTFATFVATYWFLGPGAIPAAVASTTVAVGAYLDSLVTASFLTKAGASVLMSIATWAIFRKAGKKRGHGDPL